MTTEFFQNDPNHIEPSRSSTNPLLSVPAQRPPSEVVAPVTVLVPTRNEQGNVAPLVERLANALPDHRARVLFVDDSDDDTPAEVVRVAASSPLRVDVVHRPRGQRVGGLGGAVLHGLRETDSPWVVVMDADLQHPPERIPDLVGLAEELEADVVVASRHVDGGSADGLSGVVRSLVSRSSILLSKVIFPRRLAGIADPMSGFFVMRRDCLDLDRLRPEGFKILLEVMARHRGLRRAELPFTFGDRHSGDSKASLREGLVFGRQLLRLRLAVLFADLAVFLGRGVVRRAIGFGAVGVTGIAVNSVTLWLLADPRNLGLQYLLAAILATQVSSTWNFLLSDAVVFRGPKYNSRRVRYAGFLLMSNLVLVLRVPILALLVGVLGVHYLVANALTLLLGYLVRFHTQERLTIPENIHV